MPAKGESSASNEPLDSMDGATLSDVPLTPPPASVKPPEKFSDPDATLSDTAGVEPFLTVKPPTTVVDPNATLSDTLPAAG